MTMGRLYLSTCLFFCILNSFAQDKIKIQQREQTILVGQYSYFLEDPDGNLTIEDILREEYQSKFIKNQKEVFGLTPTRSAYWFKILVQNDSPEDIFLEVSTTYIWYIDFYAPDSTSKYSNPVLTGGMRPDSNRVFPDVNWFWFPLNKKGGKDVKTYYFRAKTGAAFEMPLYVGTLNALYKKKSINDYLTAGFIGVMLIMFLYNLFILITTREILYLYYLGYILGITINATYLNGYQFMSYLTYGILSNYWWQEHFITCLFLFPTFAGLFCIQYLQLKENLLWGYWLIIIQTILLAVIFPILNLFIPLIDLANIYQLFISLFALSCVVLGVFVWIRYDKSAIIYVLGWGSLMVASFASVLAMNGILNFNSIFRNILYFGAGAEVWLFSLALANRFNKIRTEKEELIREQNKLLENKVEERTKELREKQDEILTQNEELRNIQEELEIQRDDLNMKNILLELQSKKISSSIHTAQSIQQAVLPYQSKLDKLLKDYFILYKPKDVVSGDFFWLNEIEGSTILVVADCTGHGVPGAFMTLIGHNLLDKIVRVWKIIDPSEILERLHSEINLVLQQENSNNYGMDAAVLILNRKEGITELNYAGAKIGFYYFENSRELIEVKSSRKSIGGFQNPNILYENQLLILNQGSMLYIGSDGLVDQNNAERRRFGNQRIKTLLQEICHKPLSEQKIAIEKELESFMEDTDQRDDILWLGIRL